MRYFLDFLTRPPDAAALEAALQHIAGMKAAPVQQASEIVAEDFSSFWKFAGPINSLYPSWPDGGKFNFPTSGRVNAVAFDPSNDKTWYAGSSNGGVWKTTDSGANWVSITDDWPILTVSSIAVDQSGKNIYVGTGDCPAGQGSPLAIGVMKSDDSGTTWKNVSDTGFQGSAISRVIVHPDSADLVLAADFSGYLWLSSDAGKSWAIVNPSQTGWMSVEFSAKDGKGNRTCYAVARDGKNVYVSPDKGVTWTANKSPIPSTTTDGRPLIATSPNAAATVYLFSPTDLKVWSNKTNADGTWKDLKLNYSDTQEPTYCYCFACSSDPKSKADVVYIGQYSVWLSVVGSGKWTSVEGDATGHCDTHALAVSPSDPNLLLIGNDGGVYTLTASFGPSPSVRIVPQNKTLAVPQVYQGATFFGLPTLLVGLQDTGTQIVGTKVDEWTYVTALGGDGGGCAANTFATQFGTANFFTSEIQLSYSIDGWKTSETIVDNTHLMASDGGRPVNPAILIDPYAWNLLYVPTSYLYRWTQKDPATYGGSWENRLGGQLLAGKSSNITGIAIISTNGKSGNRIYTGSSDGQVWMSDDAGTKWQKINGNLPANISVQGVSVNPDNADDLVIALGSIAPGGGLVWRCEKTTDSSPKWVDVGNAGSSDGLPSVFPLLTIARDLFDPVNGWYVAGYLGVFYTEDAGAHWYNAGHPLGLPNVVVTQLRTNEYSGVLTAATLGRGIYTAQLTVLVHVASVKIDPSSVKGGTDATGTVTMDGAAPKGGIHVYLSSSDAASVQVSPAITIDAGKTSNTFSITTNSVKSNTKVSITATYGGTSKSAEISLTVS